MIHSKKVQKIASLILCFVIFFSLGNTVNADMGKFEFKTIYNRMLSQLTETLISLGDGVLHIVAASVGETVTIDRLIFNKVNKVSIDYWNDMSNVEATAQEPIKAFMQPVVEAWYAVFFKVAVIVYMMVLVYIGIATMLSSTADKKANYKQLFISWVVGIAILFMFPYVMKYIVLINNTFVATLDENAYSEVGGTSKLVDANFLIAFTYGDPEFEHYLEGYDTDIMVLTRHAAQKDWDSWSGDISLAIMYLILVGQMIAILIMYYKRAFMIAFLIMIFPLVAMTYVLDKIGDGKNQSFGVWFKEFIVNVLVQMFHAVVYVLVTGAGIKLYLENNGENFIFTILCIFFLFEGEKILRTIFNVNSKAKTMEDIGASGAMALGVVAKTGKLFKKNDDDGNTEDKEEVKQAKQRMKNRRDRGKENNAAAIAALDEKKEAGESTASQGEYQGKDREPEELKASRYDFEDAKDTVLTGAMKRRLKKGMVTSAVQFGAGAVGATLETGRVLADGKSKPGEVVTAIAAGKSIGEALATPITATTNKLEQIYTGHKISQQILSGKMDDELGINLIKTPEMDTNASEIEYDEDYKDAKDKLDDKKQIYREALAEYAKVVARSGRDAAEIASYNYLSRTDERKSKSKK